MHPTSEDRFKEKAIPCFFNNANVLEIGPDRIPSTYLNHLVTIGINVSWNYVETEIGRNPNEHDNRRILLISDYHYNCADNLFDIVFHGQVLEHIRKPWRFMLETTRVLREGGKMIIINPAVWHYHEPLPDCWRAYPEAIKGLFDDCGIRCDYSETFNYADGTADTVSIGTKISNPLITSHD